MLLLCMVDRKNVDPPFIATVNKVDVVDNMQYSSVNMQWVADGALLVYAKETC